MGYWATPPMDRNQILLFSPTLDATIGEDHPVRLFDDILASMDWSLWEARYNGKRGQPPIHPRILSGVILYGMSLGFRSSRVLERVCTNALDFLWLVSGRSIDHATICAFRTKFSKELKDLFKQIGRLAMSMGLICLNRVGLDGTRVLANSSRHGTRTAKTLAQKLAVLDEQIAAAFAQAEQADRQEKDLFGDQTPNRLPAKVASLQKRQEALAQALAKANAMDAKRCQRTDTTNRSAKVPVADPDSAILPNKDGGHAPNYTPMAAVDGQQGFIVDAEVTNEATESQTTVPTVDRISETFGTQPEKLLADSAHGDGQNLSALAARGVEAYIPMADGGADNAARRDDPTTPVAQSDWDRLPYVGKKKTKKLDKSAFVYDASCDCYYCPAGRRMAYARCGRESRRDSMVTFRVYRCVDCGDCGLSAVCVTGSGRRTVRRDEYEPLRESTSKRMRSESGQEEYGKRKWICETPFGVRKGLWRVRRFLHRGLEKVKTEWSWTCTAYNLAKLVRTVSRLRVQFAAVSV